MKREITYTIKRRLPRAAFYLLLLVIVCFTPFAVAQRSKNRQSAVSVSPLVRSKSILPLSGSDAPFTFSNTGSLITAREFHTATLLSNGKVLVAGGEGILGAPLTSAELYDLVSRSWSATSSLNTAREFHTATLLSNGNVAV